MSRIIFFRRKKLGLGSVRGMSWHINGDLNAKTKRKMGGYIGEKSGYVRNDMMQRMPEFNPNDWLVRWGCTSPTEKFKLEKQINTSNAIKEVGFKRDFRMKCFKENESIVPYSFDTIEEASIVIPQFNKQNPANKWVVRRDRHAQGKDLWTISTYEELINLINNKGLGNEWYASLFIDKVSEYRVYMVEGRVVTIAQKTPDNPNDVAWNVAQGGEFNVLKWDDWPLDMCRVAKESFDLTRLDFAGIDLMIDADGRSYLIEINSAPSLPFLSDGSLSYRQKVMAKAFEYIRENGKGNVDPIKQYTNWRDVIHPATWTKGRKKND